MRIAIITTNENKYERTLNNVIIECENMYDESELNNCIRIAKRMQADKIEIYLCDMN